MRITLALFGGAMFLAVRTAAGADEAPPAASARANALPLVAAVAAAMQPIQPKQAPPAKAKGKAKSKEVPAPAPPPPEDLFASAPDLGGDAPIGLNPNMIGDFPGMFSLQRILLPTLQTITTAEQVVIGSRLKTIVINGRKVVVRVPIFGTQLRSIQRATTVSTVAPVVLAFSGSLKVGENQSPMPTDRVYVTYNYYNNLGVATAPQVSTQPITYGGLPATATTVIPGAPRVDVHREMLGFEKTFLNGAGSIAMRLPFAQVQGDGSVGQQDLGDMSWLLNYAFYRNVTTGNVFSGGLMTTVPTGPPQYSIAGNIHPAFLQPFVGYRWGTQRFYVQGFSSTALPTDPRFVTAMFNDISTGYWLYRAPGNNLITALIPALEAHVTTPLNHRGPDNLVTIPNIVATTAGMHVGLRNRAMLTLGVVVPLTGPQVFPIEAVAQFNWRY